jgi:hypothetical protein
MSLDIEQFRQNPPKCSCSSSPFNYSSAGHIIAWDVNIVQNEDQRSLILKDPKFREPCSFKWRHNFVSIMDSVEEYARRWAKSEGEELDTLSEWIKNYYDPVFIICRVKWGLFILLSLRAQKW